MTAVHQFVPTLEPGAVGTHLLEIRRLCDELGIRSDTFAEHLVGPMTERGRHFRDYGRAVPAEPGDVLLYHVAIGSTVADFVASRPEPLVVDHHNITPASYYADWEPPVVHGIAWGRRQLAELAGRTTLGIADSAFNESELQALGYGRTAVVPILLDTSTFDRAVDEAALERLRERSGAGTAWLFVGRIAPNKAQHDLVKAFAVYRRVYDPHAVLRVVGSSSSPTYLDALRQLVSALQLDDAVELTGGVSEGELAAHYRAADVFVCLSEHEGFCVPLLEAMHHRLPVVAYAATAVPETLAGGGLCLPAKPPTTVAAAVWRVREDRALAAQLAEAGAARLTDFDLAVTRRRMAALLQELLDRG